MHYMEDTEKYAYWLASVKGFGRRMQRHLFAQCASAAEVYALKETQLKKIAGLTQKDTQAILESKKAWDVDGEWDALVNRRAIGFVSIENDRLYPAQFREIYDAPYAVFYRGKLPSEKEFRVAIVGARMCSEYGRGMAGELAKELALQGVSIVGGMAKGIDAAGHRGALNAGGVTYAVFGCGIDVCYPNYHKQLYYDIAKSGGLLTEFLPHSAPHPSHFPQRNRLISALSDVVLIIEARQKSGSLITADFALEQGKDVYALPGRVTDALSDGCNRLISQGAGIILSVDDFLKELSLSAARKKDFADLQKKSLEKEELLVYSCLGLLPVGMEELLAKTGLEIQTLVRILTCLQQKKYIEEIYKNHYKIVTG